MNYGISVLFRAIPLAMAAFCYSYGAYVFFAGGDLARITAGPIVFFLGSICLALFATASTIIRQIIGRYTVAEKYLLPIMAYAVALATIICGIIFLKMDSPQALVPGHVICGLGLIACCVSTAATASTRFALIPKNSADTTFAINPKGFSRGACSFMVILTVVFSLVAWVWAVVLLTKNAGVGYVVAGCVMAGVACVCTSLIALVASIARQVRGTYTMSEGDQWITLVIGMGGVAFVLGLIMIFAHWGQMLDFVGFVLLGLALICWSISSKVILLAKIWHRDFKLSSRIPIIPIITALCCMFLSAFLFEEALFKMKFFVPARVLMGFGAICFTLYSIVSILESGTSKK